MWPFLFGFVGFSAWVSLSLLSAALKFRMGHQTLIRNYQIVFISTWPIYRSSNRREGFFGPESPGHNERHRPECMTSATLLPEKVCRKACTRVPHKSQTKSSTSTVVKSLKLRLRPARGSRVSWWNRSHQSACPAAGRGGHGRSLRREKTLLLSLLSFFFG